jgi:hypothetical protein
MPPLLFMADVFTLCDGRGGQNKVVARVLGLATPESILLANFGGEREESNL